MKDKILVSIISTNQINMVKKLLKCFLKIKHNNIIFSIIINDKSEKVDLKKFESLKLNIIKNNEIKGFAKNHNYSFKQFYSDYFLIINPDITFNKLKLNEMIKFLKKNKKIVATTLLAYNKKNEIQDSGRSFPNIFSPFVRIFSKKIDFNINKEINYVDWISGQFIFIESKIFKKIKGFDQKYFLYYEDVDLCKKIRNLKKKITLITNQKIIHYAQRKSKKNFKYLLIHLSSMIKYHLKHGFF